MHHKYLAKYAQNWGSPHSNLPNLLSRVTKISMMPFSIKIFREPHDNLWSIGIGECGVQVFLNTAKLEAKKLQASPFGIKPRHILNKRKKEAAKHFPQHYHFWKFLLPNPANFLQVLLNHTKFMKIIVRFLHQCIINT